MEDFENAFDIKPEDKKPKGKRKKISVYNLVLYCIAAALIITGVVMLVNEFWLVTRDETDGLIAEEDIYPEAETYTPLATPVDDYDLIPVKFHFIDRNASCDVYATGIEDDGTMGTVSSADDITWLSVSPYVAPGDVGNAVLSGHNLWKGKAGIFSLLKKVQTGEIVAVTFNKGFTRYFEVYDKYECLYNETTPMKTAGVDEPILTLITCQGDWDSDIGSSTHRIVVLCRPVKASDIQK